jgi:ParB-like chromosome segregation protein Spo0J
VLPPISVVRVGDRYAVRDGHHRVSVAKARGAVTIDATVDAAAAA